MFVLFCELLTIFVSNKNIVLFVFICKKRCSVFFHTTPKIKGLSNTAIKFVNAFKKRFFDRFYVSCCQSFTSLTDDYYVTHEV